MSKDVTQKDSFRWVLELVEELENCELCLPGEIEWECHWPGEGRNRRARVLSGAGNKDIKSMDSRLMFPSKQKRKMSLTFIEMKFKKRGRGIYWSISTTCLGTIEKYRKKFVPHWKIPLYILLYYPITIIKNNCNEKND